MVDAAVDWAKNRNLWRVNPIHKEEEIKIVVEDFFKYTDQQAYELPNVELWKWRTLANNC